MSILLHSHRPVRRDRTVRPVHPGQVAADSGAPLGITLATGALLVIAVDLVCARVPAADGGVRLGVLAICLALFAAAVDDAVAVGLLVVISALLFDGFLVNRQGDLSWHGSADVVRLSTLVAAALVGLAVAWIRRRPVAPRASLVAVEGGE